MATKLKRRGLNLEVRSFVGKDRRNYIVFRSTGGSYHAFVEIEAKQAARECGAATEKNTRAMWGSVWRKR
jgi:hypothetical protein